MKTLSRCDEGKKLNAQWRKDYDDAVKSNGDWMKAFCAKTYSAHAINCPQCLAFEKARHSEKWGVRQEIEIEDETASLVNHEVAALKKMRAELLADGSEYNIRRTNSIPEQIKSIQEASR